MEYFRIILRNIGTNPWLFLVSNKELTSTLLLASIFKLDCGKIVYISTFDSTNPTMVGLCEPYLLCTCPAHYKGESWCNNKIVNF